VSAAELWLLKRSMSGLQGCVYELSMQLAEGLLSALKSIENSFVQTVKSLVHHRYSKVSLLRGSCSDQGRHTLVLTVSLNSYLLLRES
jgi:hypothetical protein